MNILRRPFPRGNRAAKRHRESGEFSVRLFRAVNSRPDRKEQRTRINKGVKRGIYFASVLFIGVSC